MFPTKPALRLARRWREAWEAAFRHEPDPATAWERLAIRFEAAARVHGRLAFARAGLFPRGVRTLESQLRNHLAELVSLARPLRDALATEPPPVPALASWLAEVRQLEAEFDTVEVRWKESVVRAVTEPVELRDVDLGRFAVDFHWHRLGNRDGVRCFDVVALDPNPAAGRDDVPHPHVYGVDLCAGDATGPVERALHGGRFAEAFLLIRAVLGTYNPDSPYVRLEQWDGSPCRDCGERVREEDVYRCEGCDADLCSGCSTSCTVCDSTRCPGCLETCSLCHREACPGCLTPRGGDERICPRCFDRCVCCGGRVPRDELEDRRCPDCSPDPEEETSDDEPGPVHAGIEVE
jgi:hypothetical protein